MVPGFQVIRVGCGGRWVLVCTLCFWCVLDPGGDWWWCYLGLVVCGLTWTAFFGCYIVISMVVGF